MATNYSTSSPVQTASASPVRLLSLRDAATYLSISYWTLRDLVWCGDLPSVRVGRRILIDHEDLNRFIERNKQVESR
jgi:excisionase family DNA binding protein